MERNLVNLMDIHMTIIITKVLYQLSYFRVSGRAEARPFGKVAPRFQTQLINA